MTFIHLCYRFLYEMAFFIGYSFPRRSTITWIVLFVEPASQPAWPSVAPVALHWLSMPLLRRFHPSPYRALSPPCPKQGSIRRRWAVLHLLHSHHWSHHAKSLTLGGADGFSSWRWLCCCLSAAAGSPTTSRSISRTRGWRRRQLPRRRSNCNREVRRQPRPMLPPGRKPAPPPQLKRRRKPPPRRCKTSTRRQLRAHRA